MSWRSRRRLQKLVLLCCFSPIVAGPAAAASQLNPEEYGDDEIVVAVVDTFADTDHPALDGRVRNVETTGDDPPGNHGTAVAGVIVENAPDADVVVFTNNPDLAGPEFIELGNRELADSVREAVDFGVDVINVSYSFEWDISGAFQSAVDYAWDNGVLVIISSGNQGSASCGNVSPSGQNPVHDSVLIDRAFVVSGVGADGQHWPCANTGDYVDAAALAEDVRVPVVGGGFDTYSGTSFAAPQWAALAARILEVYPGLPPGALTEMMLRFSSSAVPFAELTAADIVALRNDNVGNGTPEFDAFETYAAFEDGQYGESHPSPQRWDGFQWVADIPTHLAMARTDNCLIIPSVRNGFSDFGPPEMDLSKLAGSNSVSFTNVYYNHHEILGALAWDEAKSEVIVSLEGNFASGSAPITYPLNLSAKGCAVFTDVGSAVDLRHEVRLFVDACELIASEQYTISAEGFDYPYPIVFPASIHDGKRCEGIDFEDLGLEPPPDSASSGEIRSGVDSVVDDVEVTLSPTTDDEGNGLGIRIVIGAAIVLGVASAAVGLRRGGS